MTGIVSANAAVALARLSAILAWMTGVPEEKKATLIPAGWFDTWADATWATDPEGAKAPAGDPRAEWRACRWQRVLVVE